jgi:O-antigen ligase
MSDLPTSTEMRRTRFDALIRPLKLPFEPWWALWVLAISASWVLPTHLIPWHAFHADLLMVIALLPAAFWVAMRTSQPALLPPSALAAFCAALLPLAQLAGGLLHFSGDAWIASAYVFGFGVAILIGARLEQVAPGRLLQVLFAAFCVAGAVSTGLALYQLLQLSGLGLLTIQFPPTGYRPFGNLGQSNHLATLLVWGLVALWWLYLSGKARGWVVVGAAAFLMVGIVATQSRTAWMEIALLAVAAAVYRRPLAARASLLGLFVLAGFFIALTMAWGSVTRALSFEAARSLAAEMSPGLRPPAWRLFADAIARQPWTGWGWNQISVAQSAVALDHPALGYTFQSTHNLVLDLLVQSGIPAGLLIVAGLVLWFLAKARKVDTPAACLLLLAVAVLLVHALLEFPQNYAYFLLPAGLMMGMLEAMLPAGPLLQIRRRSLVLLLCLGSVLAAWIAVEYNVAERSLERVRFERARVGPSRNSQAPDLVMLTQLREFLRFLRLRYTEPATPEQLEAMRRVVEHYPSDGNHMGLAIAAASSGQLEMARVTLARMCHMVPAARCDQALESWRAMAKTSPALSAVQLPR